MHTASQWVEWTHMPNFKRLTPEFHSKPVPQPFPTSKNITCDWRREEGRPQMGSPLNSPSTTHLHPICQPFVLFLHSVVYCVILTWRTAASAQPFLFHHCLFPIRFASPSSSYCLKISQVFSKKPPRVACGSDIWGSVSCPISCSYTQCILFVPFLTLVVSERSGMYFCFSILFLRWLLDPCHQGPSLPVHWKCLSSI